MKYFTIKELCRSNTATQYGIDNTPNDEVVGNLTKLVDNVLDPLRERYGKPIIVNSGYRSPELNRKVGGARKSMHMDGMAADIDTNNIQENRVLFDIIKNNLDFDQLIWEKGGSWVHVSYREGNNRHQTLNL